jgi:hypothetical protein
MTSSAVISELSAFWPARSPEDGFQACKAAACARERPGESAHAGQQSSCGGRACDNVAGTDGKGCAVALAAHILAAHLQGINQRAWGTAAARQGA